ncbi:hypothetical protein PN836_014485 [Ningiella sp. W23]|uniref:hypothetical protein n=1 Tax=Ningiella sp. W23 TaxID=3023715 RepID=UPI003756CF05
MNKSLVFATTIGLIIGFAIAWIIFNGGRVDHMPNAEISTPIGKPDDLAANSELSAIGSVHTPSASAETVSDEKAISNIQNMDSATSSSNELTRLKSQITNLEEMIVSQAKQSASRYANLEVKFKQAQNMLEQQGQKLESISEEEAKAILPEPFASVLARSTGTMVETFKELQTQEEDYDWALMMQQKISDFFITHELSDRVSVQSVICKKSICEIRGFEAQRDIASQVMSAMSAQPWWTFNSTHSSTGDDEEFGRYFYVIARATP